MAAQVGALRVTLGANTAQFEAGMTRAQAQARRTGQDITTSLNGAQRTVTTAFNSMKTAAIGFAAGLAGAGVAALGGMARSVLEFADNLDAAATQANMSVTRYQTLREAFRALEVDARSTDRIFRQLQTTLGDVQNGADNAATAALDRLGIRARVLNGEITTSDQLLDALAESSRTAGTAAQFTSEIVDIFGQRVGPQLAAAIRDGGDALHELEAAMIDTGTVIDEEMVQRLAEANETMDRFFASTQRQAAIWSASIIESFQSAANAVVDFHNAYNLGPTSLGLLGTLLGTGRPGTRRNENSGIIGSALSQLNPAANRRAPRPTARGGGGGGGARRRGGGGGSRAARATRTGDLEDFVSPWLEGPTMAQMEQDAIALRGGINGVEQALAELAAVPLPDLGNMLTTEDREEMEAFSENFMRDLTDGLAQAIVYGEDLGEALLSTIRRAASELISSGLMQLLTGGGQGGGGVLGSLMQSVGGINFGGAGGKVKGMATGGSFVIGGNGGVDRNLLSLNGVPVARVSRGETVGVSPNSGGGKVEIFLHDELLQARILAGAGVVVREAAPRIATRGAGMALKEMTKMRMD